MRWSLMLCRGPSADWKAPGFWGEEVRLLAGALQAPSSWCFKRLKSSKIEILQERFWRYLRSLIEVFDWGLWLRSLRCFRSFSSFTSASVACRTCVINVFFLLPRMMQGVVSPEQKWSSAGKFNRRGWLLSLEESLCIFCMLKSVQMKLEVKLHDTWHFSKCKEFKLHVGHAWSLPTQSPWNCMKSMCRYVI